MSQHPSTFAGESSGDKGVGWDDFATLHLREDGGVLHGFKAVRKGTLAEMVKFVANLPVADRPHYMIEKAGDRQYHWNEIMALLRRPDFPLQLGE